MIHWDIPSDLIVTPEMGSVVVESVPPDVMLPAPSTGIEFSATELPKIPEATSPSVSEKKEIGTQQFKDESINAQKDIDKAQKEIQNSQKIIHENRKMVLNTQNQMFAKGVKTTMIITVKKRNVTDLKEGRINSDEFVKRAEIIQY